MSDQAVDDKTGSIWLVSVAIAGGLAAAFHMGKIPAAIPPIRTEFGLDLFRSGLIVSSFSVLAAISGVLLGYVARRLGPRPAGSIGLVATAAGAAIGAIADSYTLLIGSRVLEGLGFLMVAVTMPGLISRISATAWKSLALGIWGAFIPAAMSLMLVIAPPILSLSGWRGLWWLTAMLSGSLALIFLQTSRGLTSPSGTRSGGVPAGSSLPAGPLLIALAFACYSALFAAVTAFLPTFWNETSLVSLTAASRLASLAVTGNILGNIAAGFLIGRGVSFTRLLLLALLGGSACAALVFTGDLPTSGQLLAALGFTTLSGLLPGAVFASIDRVSTVQSSIPLVTGVIFQGAGIGQVLGPAGLSYAVEGYGGWDAAAFLIIGIGVAGALFVILYAVWETAERPSG